MRSPVLALAWQVWRPYRRGLAVCAAVWLVLAALGLFMPRGAWAPAAPEGNLIIPAAIVVSALFAAAFILMLFAFSAVPIDAQLDAGDTGFPTRMFTLPVSTAVLTAVPMVQGAAVAALGWVAWAGAVLRPVGMDVDLMWPAVLTAALVAWLQALVWWPFPLRFLRVIVVAPVLAVIAMAPAFALALGAPSVAVTAGLAALLPAAYGVALVGVARARRGDAPTWTWPSWLASALAWRPSTRRAPFASPLQAQTWFEWRMRGLSFPVTVGLVAVVWLLIALTGVGEQVIGIVAAGGDAAGVSAAVAAMTAPGVLLVQFLGIVLFLAGVVGADLGGVRLVDQKPSGGTFGCHPFLALRPLTDGELILAKLRMAVRSTLTGWSIVLIVVFLALGPTGKWRELAGMPLLQTHSALEVCAGLSAGLAGLVFLTWLLLVGNLWLGMTGRRWLVRAFGAFAFGVCMALVLLAHWLSPHPETVAALMAALPYVAVVAVLLKLLLAAWLARILLRRGLIGPRALGISAAAWGVVVAGVVALGGQLAPVGGPSLWRLVLGAALVLPLNRFAAAPLALEWNRHR
ncbi:MAG TPA: hypothetical protein VMS17_08285 [Gemmataceae bacterium]|nr:hypothetical protein [Gemmataceae bacterium]